MMSLESLSIGERIVLVARLAAEAHLGQMAAEKDHLRRQNEEADGVGLVQRVTEDARSPETSRDHNRARFAEGAAVR